MVNICETETMLTVKEFDVFALLIMNPRRVLTYDMIIDLVWHENLDYYSHRAINNHVSSLLQKWLCQRTFFLITAVLLVCFHVYTVAPHF